MDFDELWETFMANCRQIFALAYSTDETEQQKKLKDWFKKFSIRLLNFFFVIILLMALYIGFDWLFNQYSAWWPYLKDDILKNISGFVLLVLLLLVTITFIIQGLLWLFKWITITDVFKLYIFFELSVLFLNFSKADRVHKGPVVLQMVDKVFHTDFFSNATDTVTVASKTILIRPRGIVIPK